MRPRCSRSPPILTNLGAEIGFLSILHTWGQTLVRHPHVHCVVPGGGFSQDRQRWIPLKYTGFFLPVKVLSRVFRGKFIKRLRRAYVRGELDLGGASATLRTPPCWHAFVDALFRTDWVVYAKPAFGGPAAVLRYLGRYTHRVAISNHRLVAFNGERVTFRWKDYTHDGQRRTMILTAMEFLRCLCSTCSREASCAFGSLAISPITVGPRDSPPLAVCSHAYRRVRCPTLPPS